MYDRSAENWTHMRAHTGARQILFRKFIMR